MKNIIQDAQRKAREKRLAFIARELAKGRSQVQIAEKLDISKQRVGKLIKDAGLK